MEAKTVYEVLKKLIGPIEPVSDSAIDSEREKNLETFINVFREMHTEIDDISYQHRESQYASAKKLGLMCSDQLDDMGIKNCSCPNES